MKFNTAQSLDTIAKIIGAKIIGNTTENVLGIKDRKSVV